MISACLGLALNIIPSLSISYLLTATCIISIAQQAKPNVKGHSDPPLAQFSNFLNFNFIQSNNIFTLLYSIPDKIIIIIASVGNIALKATLKSWSKRKRGPAALVQIVKDNKYNIINIIK